MMKVIHHHDKLIMLDNHFLPNEIKKKQRFIEKYQTENEHTKL